MNPNHANSKHLELWKTPDSWFGKPWRGWYVGLDRTRDSGTLVNSNFECFLKTVGEASAGKVVDDSANGGDSSEIEAVYVVNEGHWACGWVEWIAVHESDDAALVVAEELMNSLENYPVLDEEHLTNLEFKAEDEAWNNWACQALVEAVKDEDLKEWAEGLDDGILYDAYRYAMEECNEYPMHEDSGVYIDTDAIAEKFEKHLRELWEKEIDGPDAVKQTAFGFARILTEEV
ncbi:MAG: hypothetical protein ACREA0_01625 [bacterium]